MNQISTLERIIRGVLIALVLLFFLFPIFWILLMSFQNNDQILRIPPSLFFEPTLQNYTALLTGRLETTAGNLDIAFMRNLGNSLLLSTCSVLLALVLGVPAAYAFARYNFRLGVNIAFTDWNLASLTGGRFNGTDNLVKLWQIAASGTRSATWSSTC